MENDKKFTATNVLEKFSRRFPNAYYWNQDNRNLNISSAKLKEDLIEAIDWNQNPQLRDFREDFRDNHNRIIVIGESHDQREYLKQVDEIIRNDNGKLKDKVLVLLEEEIDDYCYQFELSPEFRILSPTLTQSGNIYISSERAAIFSESDDDHQCHNFYTSSSAEQRIIRSLAKNNNKYPLTKKICDFTIPANRYDSIKIDGNELGKKTTVRYSGEIMSHDPIQCIYLKEKIIPKGIDRDVASTIYRNKAMYEKLKNLNNNNQNKVIIVVAGAYHVINQNTSNDFLNEDPNYINQAIGLSNLLGGFPQTEFIIEENVIKNSYVKYHIESNPNIKVEGRDGGVSIIEIIKNNISEIEQEETEISVDSSSNVNQDEEEKKEPDTIVRSVNNAEKLNPSLTKNRD